jgi:ABC-2 type transport system permease protein
MNRFFNHRLLALMQKELDQIRRDRRIVISLIVPPVLQLLLFGFVLNSKVENLRLGVIDQSRTPESRELIADLSESRSFRLTSSFLAPTELTNAISDGRVQAGLVIPYDFARDLQRGRQANVQFLLNAMDANTATIARNYAQGVITAYSSNLQGSGLHAQFDRIGSSDVGRPGRVDLQPSFLYNPGLLASWFTVTGVLGLLCILNGSLVASDTMVKEREVGTIEQLLMSPASTSEIIVAKIAPLFFLLCIMALLSIGLARLVFDVPFHGSFLLVYFGATLCLLSGIGIGTFIATFTKSAEQSQLASFFVNPPLSALSGAITPMESMPRWMQPLAELNPIYHFGVIARASMLKGSGMETLWPNFLALFAIAITLVSLSVLRFRKQLG